MVVFFFLNPTLSRKWINQVNCRGHSLDYTNLSNSSQLMSQLRWQTYNTVFANWYYFNTIGELAVVCIAVNIL